MSLQNLSSELAKGIKGRIETQVPMNKHTTWRVGGPADFLVWAESPQEVQTAIQIANEYQLPWQVIGNGSNLLVLDQGLRGITIKLSGALTSAVYQEQEAVAGGGMLLPKLAREFVKAGYTGLEFAGGIPGTVGGATTMNAGAHGNSLGDLVVWVEIVDGTGELRILRQEQLNFGYRSSILKETKGVVTQVGLKLVPGDQKLSEVQLKEWLERRNRTQPVSQPNAGSVFKNPPGDSAGRLIEQAGGKGLRVGDAMVSEKHANFIVNLGNATAQDVLTLIEKVRNLVQAQTKTILELEVLVMGE